MWLHRVTRMVKQAFFQNGERYFFTGAFCAAMETSISVQIFLGDKIVEAE